MHQQLDAYVESNLPKVRVLHIPKRKGLITAKLVGAHNATGQVLLFLDSHIEANVNWLPPLLGKVIGAVWSARGKLSRAHYMEELADDLLNQNT